MGPFSLNGFRFPLAILILAALFRKQLRKIDRTILLHGSIIGFFFFMTMAFEMIGLKHTDSSTTSFLENTAIIFVPLVNALLIRRLPRAGALLSALIAVVGVGFLTLKNGHFGFSFGEICCLTSALFYTGTVLTTDRFSKRDDPMLLGVVQVAFIALAAPIAALLFETPRVPTSPDAWIVLLFLAVVCTCFGFTLQPVAQSRVSPDTAGLFCAFNPLITAILGYAFLGERLGTNRLIGGALILLSIVVAALMNRRDAERPEQDTACPAGETL